MKSTSLQYVISFFMLGISIIFWWSHQSQMGMNMNIEWLYISAQRILDGNSLTSSVYETNPPFNILIYMPIALLTEWFSLNSIQATHIYIPFLVTLFSMIFIFLLRNTEELNKDIRFVLFAAYLISITLVPSYYFGDREHLVILGAIPFLLYSWGYNRESKYKILVGICLVLCSFTFLIKPQFLVLPALLYLFKIYKMKSLLTIFEMPALILSTSTAAYIAILYFIFPEYVFEILPIFKSFYLDFINEANVARAFFNLLVLNVALAAFAQITTPKNSRPAFVFFVAAMISLLSFAIQGKGFYYHLIPYFQFMLLGITLTCLELIPRIGFPSLNKIKIPLTLTLTLLIGFALHFDKASRYIYPDSYISGFPEYTLTNTSWPHHHELTNSPLAQLVNQYASGGSYYIYAGMPQNMTPSVYSHASYASRFPAYWFLPFLEYAAKHKILPDETIILYRIKFGDMIAEDLVRYAPRIAIIGQLYAHKDADAPLDFANYFSPSDAFKTEWSHYKKLKTVELLNGHYARGYHYGNLRNAVQYDIYIRNDEYDIK